MPENTRPGRARALRATAALGAAALAGALAAAVAPAASAATPATYYVDCQATGSTQTGSQAEPFTTLAKASSHVFQPGESLLFKRGTVCDGALTVQGSGTSASWNTLGAYGDASQPLPAIDGGTATTDPSAVALKNVSYWNVQDLDIAGGYWRGLWIEADQAGVTQQGFKLTDLKVHDQGNIPRVDPSASPVKSDWISGTGSVIVEPCQATAKIANVTIDDVDAYNGHEVGFQIGHAEKAVYDPTTPGGYNTPDCHMGLTGTALPPKDGVSDVTIENSGAAYNTASGIWGSGVTDLTITGNNQLHDNGNGTGVNIVTGEPTPSLLNGEGAWWSNSYNVSVTGNTSYDNKRGGGDGGGFDADTYSTKSVIDHNTVYGNDAYCVAVFGGRDLTTSDVQVTDNTCTGNGVSASPTAQAQGDIFTWTSDRQPPATNPTAPKSTIQNLTVNHNTITRTAPGPWLASQSDYLPGEASFWDNTVTHTVGTDFVDIQQCPTDWNCDTTQPQLNLNTYEVTGSTPATFVVGPYQAQTAYTAFADYQQLAKQDPQSTFKQP